MNKKFREFWKANRSLVLFIVLMSVFRSAVADWNTVPTGSMQPTIVPGDRIAVNKMAYDLRLPFSHISLMATGEPQRGDIVVFESAAADTRMVKRIIGLPGEQVAMRGQHLYINGEAADYQQLTAAETEILAQESLGEMRHAIQLDQNRPSPLDSFEAVVVPEDHYLVLGDNRRNSADSRVYGFIPRSEITGKATAVVMSFDYDDYYLPRADRWFMELI